MFQNRDPRQAPVRIFLIANGCQWPLVPDDSTDTKIHYQYPPYYETINDERVDSVETMVSYDNA